MRLQLTASNSQTDALVAQRPNARMAVLLIGSLRGDGRCAAGVEERSRGAAGAVLWRRACVLALGALALQSLCALPSAHARRVTTRASSELAGYTDSMHVHVASPTIGASVGDEIAGWSLGARYLVDVVSAASVDIIATASPRWMEVRQVGSIDAGYKHGDLSLGAAGTVSNEPDYLAGSAALMASLELFDKNLTPFVGARYGHDDVGRRGLAREHWQVLQRGGLQLGLTFVINRFVIASAQVDMDFERGYLAKPYRYIPLFDSGQGSQVPAGASPDLVNALRVDERPVDRLPTDRDRYALTGRIAGRWRSTTLRMDERVYRDSWGLWASTTELRVLTDTGPRVLLWPHLRVHAQSSVQFWQRAYERVELADGSRGVPRYRTGDRELSALQTTTLGLGCKLRLSHPAQSPWFLQVQIDAAYTHFFDALYVTERWSLFSALGLSAQWN